MKKFIFVLAAASFITACNTEQKSEPAAMETPATEAAAVTQPEVPLPYVPTYGRYAETGKQEYAAMILQGSWKDWDDNKLDNMKNWMADSILVFHSDMTTSRGVDNIMARWKKDRSNYSVVLDTINVVLPVYNKQYDQHWVLVWATSITTDLKGKTDTSAIMEAWRINKDGKADYLSQYDRAKRKK